MWNAFNQLANAVTAVRGVLAGGVAALAVADQVPAMVALATVALVLDAVDGQVARRTGTVSAFGARFDLEVDAFLILVLSTYVAWTTAWWVLAIGLARYVFVAAKAVLPWLRGSVPARYWCKVVAALQGVVLTVVAADLLPRLVELGALAVALVLLAESFGREVWQLWAARDALERAPSRPAVSRGITVAAVVTVWLALVAPDDLSELTPAAFARIPLEGLVLVALALVLRPRGRRTAAVVFGVALGLVVIVKGLDMGFYAVLDRPFEPLSDYGYFGPGLGVLGDSVGGAGAIVIAVGAALLVVGVLALMPLAVVRVADLVARHRPGSVRPVIAVGIVWVLCAVAGLQVASTSAAARVDDLVGQVSDDLADRDTFAREIKDDDFADMPDDQLLTALRGKDVLLVFVESYGRIAVQDSAVSPGITALLDEGTGRLRAAGYSSQSAFLTSPTFGAGSWLAHASVQAGLWVDSERRYGQLLDADRLTLTDAFGRAGWRTVFDVPANTEDWPEGEEFYGYDHIYDSRNVDYEGPEFGYASMPDQYTLAELHRRELTDDPDRANVMAEVDLVSSHHPWTPLPHLIDWDDIGDGSVYDGLPEQGESKDELFADPDDVRTAYGQSIEYSIDTLVSYLETYPDPDLVVVMLGDHQPHTYVTGENPGHDVPITVIAQDPAVMDRIKDWGWQDGMRPDPDASVWRMDEFRDRFLTAFGPR